MNAWSGSGEEGDGMGPTVARAESAKPPTPPLKNGNDLRESGYLIAVGSRTSRFRRKYRNSIPLIVIILVILLLLIGFIIITILYALALQRKPLRICRSRECLRSAANLATSMDPGADPCENFYQYACGNWASDHPRPDSYHSYDWFRDKQTKVYTVVRDFLTRNTSGHPRPVQQAKDMYTACMDTETLDKRGLKPVIDILETLGLPAYPTYINATDLDYDSYKFDWVDAVIKTKVLLGMDVLIGFDIFTDPKNSSVYRLVMGSPETTNPFPSMHNERKRYTGRKTIKTHKTSTKESLDEFFYNADQSNKATDDDDDKKLEQIHKLFYAELMKLFVLESEGITTSKLTEVELDQNIIVSSNEYYEVYIDIYDIESDNSTDSEDESYLNVPQYTIVEIQAHTDKVVENNNATASSIWKRYLEGVFNISDVTLDFEKDKVLVSDPDLKYMSLMAAYVAKTPPVVLELYIWIKVVEVMSVHTTTELRILFQRAYEQSHSNSESTPPRSLQCANAVNDMLGMAVSYAIAEPHFYNVTQPKIITMINELKNALAHLVGKAKWMDDNTKLATYQKIIEMKTLIGFPEWLLEEGKLEDYYKELEIDTVKHLENMITIIQVKIKKALNKFREGNNYTWATDPTEVNAYHTFQENTITVPMVMLQHPFFDLGLDSLNYGSLGTVLGHEITHGFDNFGRQFDRHGNLLPWWSNATIESFVNMTQCFIDQYSSFYLPELQKHVDGKKTLGENIADNGGLREALDAYKHHLKKRGPEEKLPGFEKMTSLQLFFLSYGNLWCGVSTKASLKGDLEDEHSPQLFRAQGALQNNEDFARAFHCPDESSMNPKRRCIIF